MTQGESRWPVIVAIIVIFAVLELMPSRVRVMPGWFPYAATILLLASILASGLVRIPVFARIERAVIFGFVLLTIALMLVGLAGLIESIVSPTKELSGITLLTSAIAIWFINILAFSLLYWQIDQGGPEKRLSGNEQQPDILFPESPTEMSPRRSFMDYLFFAFTTSTAFSPTETYPITSRMKALMMAQSMISLATIVVIAGRAINILK
jgi:uncharacterized membrane protein